MMLFSYLLPISKTLKPNVTLLWSVMFGPKSDKNET
jgi:hypothetical protein